MKFTVSEQSSPALRAVFKAAENLSNEDAVIAGYALLAGAIVQAMQAVPIERLSRAIDAAKRGLAGVVVSYWMEAQERNAVELTDRAIEKARQI